MPAAVKRRAQYSVEVNFRTFRATVARSLKRWLEGRSIEAWGADPLAVGLRICNGAIKFEFVFSYTQASERISIGPEQMESLTMPDDTAAIRVQEHHHFSARTLSVDRGASSCIAVWFEANVPRERFKKGN